MAGHRPLLALGSGRPEKIPVPDDICVVIPAHNEELLLGRCIRSVLAAGLAPGQVYVVNDGSTDATAAVAAAVRGINLLTNDAPCGKLGALRRGIAHFGLVARYRYLAILDADSHVGPAYFTEGLVPFLTRPDVVLVCGAPHSERHNWLTAYRAVEYALTQSTFRAGQSALKVITVAPGCASIYATRILAELEWDSQTLVEDMDLTIQIHRKRLGAIAFTPHAKAYTQDPRTMKQYVGQLTRWYSGTWQVMMLRRLPFGGQRIDAEIALLTGEGLLYGLLFLLLPVFAVFRPASVLAMLVVDQALWLTLAVAFALVHRRADILRAFPFFLFIRFVNCAVLLRTFWLEVIRRRGRREWFFVGRYRSVPESSHA
jgi:cellulose synthase/poly-beta-1,6-N-acetylglucosamine synthase-like glycosyltransferase